MTERFTGHPIFDMALALNDFLFRNGKIRPSKPIPVIASTLHQELSKLAPAYEELVEILLYGVFAEEINLFQAEIGDPPVMNSALLRAVPGIDSQLATLPDPDKVSELFCEIVKFEERGLGHFSDESLDVIEPVINARQIMIARRFINAQTQIPKHVWEYADALVHSANPANRIWHVLVDASSQSQDCKMDFENPGIRLTLCVRSMAKVRAALQGRTHVMATDVEHVFRLAIRHSLYSENCGELADLIIGEIIRKTPQDSPK